MPVTERHPESPHEDRQQLLSFFFGGEEYATEILRIREVVEYQRLTPVPTTPAWVRGVMNLRGTVVPVLDLATKFQYGETLVEKLTCVVIFEIDLDGEVTPIGVMIDAVGRVVELAEDEIQEPPSFGSPVRTDLLVGIAMVDETPIPILDIQKVLTEDELALAVAGAEIAAARELEPEPHPEANPEPTPEQTPEGRKKTAETEPEGKATSQETPPKPATGRKDRAASTASEKASPGKPRSRKKKKPRKKGAGSETGGEKTSKAKDGDGGKKEKDDDGAGG